MTQHPGQDPGHDPGRHPARDGGPQDEVEFFTPDGELARHRARYGPDRRAPGRAGLAARPVVLDGGWKLLQYRLPLSARGDRRAYAALERGIGAALTVERAYGARTPRRFTRLVGQNLDVSEPFVLFERPRAAPLAQRGEELGIEELGRVMAELALVVRLLERAGVVHRAISPETVLWDGEQVYVRELLNAMPAHSAREAFGRLPWAAPEQYRGTGRCDPRDDLWSAAMVMYHVMGGRPDGTAAPPPDLDTYNQLAALRDSGAFAPLAADRPSPATVLDRLGVPDPAGPAARPGDELDAGRAEYAGHLADKRRFLGGDGHTAPSGGDPPGGGPADLPPDVTGPAPGAWSTRSSEGARGGSPGTGGGGRARSPRRTGLGLGRLGGFGGFGRKGGDR
ncbi:hypothetical protein RKE29_04030 [Streptomyces sp. B1866]|uniref:hypothetical protein n=1 Tax=Streptomyces sp. B1866 TaxID=3075431 RepID=UPI0028901E81|nr:hypothetical protein [Streptomyces sp. B1866]MDT3395819.1 hypothetical protein [Streptomyces sp. B1866]